MVLTDASTRRRRKMFLLAGEIGLTHDNLLDLATIMLRRDIISLTHLDDAQVSRMLDALEGYEKISFLLDAR